jgi:hypothetical protein
MRSIAFIAVFAVIGLVAGYAVFGKVAGHYLSLGSLFSFGSNALQSAWQSVSGIEAARNHILLCGAGGAVAGLLLALKFRK